MKIATMARIDDMNSETLALSGMPLPSMPNLEDPARKQIGLTERSPSRPNAHDVEIRNGDDQRFEDHRGDGEDARLRHQHPEGITLER
jgi:hypothetical protein